MAANTKPTRTVAVRTPAAPLSTTAITPANSYLGTYVFACAAALYALFQIYGPALKGPFVFDDLFLLYTNPHAATIPLREWLGVRPVLGLAFWADFQLWGRQPLPFRITNLLLHFASSALLFGIFRRLLQLAGSPSQKRTVLAGFGATLFLVHPVQTEAVAYIASRSETLSLFFFLLAFSVFLRRKRSAIQWRPTLPILFLFLLAVGSKEPAVTLPALLLLTDYFWNPGFRLSGIRANARLYVPIAAAALMGVAFMFHYLRADPMIGLHVSGLSPASYFLTECRAIFTYLRLFILPLSQTIDYDFPIAYTPLQHGAGFALAALVALTAAAVFYRKRYPLASYGFLAFLLFLSPTSSLIPINDVIAERRLYLPFFALVIILFEPLTRIRVEPLRLAPLLALLCCGYAIGTWNRAHVWSDTMLLFRDAAEKAPHKARARIGYANALYHERRCQEAVNEYRAATALKPPDYTLYFNLAAALDCAGSTREEAEMLTRSNALKPQPNTFVLLGRALTREGRLEESLASFRSALELDAAYYPAYLYRAGVYAALGKSQAAYDDYLACLKIDPQNETAQQGIALLTNRR